MWLRSEVESHLSSSGALIKRCLHLSLILTSQLDFKRQSLKDELRA